MGASSLYRRRSPHSPNSLLSGTSSRSRKVMVPGEPRRRTSRRREQSTSPAKNNYEGMRRSFASRELPPTSDTGSRVSHTFRQVDLVVCAPMLRPCRRLVVFRKNKKYDRSKPSGSRIYNHFFSLHTIWVAGICPCPYFIGIRYSISVLVGVS